MSRKPWQSVLGVVAAVATLIGPTHAQVQAQAQVTLREILVFDRFLIEEAVLDALANPEGAMIEGIYGGEDSDGPLVVCGRVNAKMQTGEYMGWLDFTGVLYAQAEDPAASRFRRLMIGRDACPLPDPPADPIAQP